MKIYHVFHIFVVLLSGFLLSSPCLWAQRIPKKGLSSISKKAYAVKKLNSLTGQPLQNQLLASVRKNLQQQKQTEQLITSRINGYRDLVIEMQKHMIAAPAVSPHHGGEGEDAKVQYLMKVLKTLPFDELYVIPVKDPKAKTGVRPNIIAKYYGKNTHKNMWVMAHTDVVSPGELSAWKTDPFTAVVKGVKIYGRGSEDNHQGLISAILAAKAVMEQGVRPEYNYSLLINANEEMGSEYGVRELLRNHQEIFSPGDVFLVPDAGNAEGTMVEVAEKNLLWIKFSVHGKQAHAAFPYEGVNAARASSYLLIELDKSLHKKFNKKDSLFKPGGTSSFEPTKREAAPGEINTVPGVDVFHLDCRILPSYKNEDVLQEISRVVKSVEGKFQVKIQVDILMQETHLPTDFRHPFVKLIVKSVREVYQNNPRPMGDSGSTVASFVRNSGYPAVVFSKLFDKAHQPNEYSSIQNTLGDAKVFSLVLLRLK